MSAYINQMLGCLIIAAGIGGVVGWLLRHVSAGKSAQLLADVTAMMRLKEQMLEKARHELREATSKLQAIENPAAALQEAEFQASARDRYIRELEQCQRHLNIEAEDNESLPADKAA